MRKRDDLQVLLPDGSTRPLSSFQLPTAALMLAALLLVASIFLPYWKMVLKAPQYPSGLTTTVYLNHIEGDQQEIDELNHYLGMPSLDEGGKLERRMSIIAVATMSMLLMAATFVHDRRAAWLALPALAYPVIFLADLQYILYRYGHSIDPTSALGGAIKPFTPPILGPGTVGQFGTESSLEAGFYLALASVITMVVALWLHRRAWRPVMMAWRSVAVLLLLAVCAVPSLAAETRTVGAGACATINAAVAASSDGDVVRVLPGVYREHVIVNRSITIEGVDGPVIDGGGHGTVVILARPNAVLRGLVIRNSGIEPDEDDAGVRIAAAGGRVENCHVEEVLFGIYAARAPGVVVRGNDVGGMKRFDSARRGDGIRLWYCKDALVADNRLHDTRDLVAWYCENVVVRGNVIERDRYGVHFMYSNGAHVSGNRLRGNSVGVYTMYSKDVVIEGNDIVGSRGPSGYGLGFKDVDDVTVRDNNLLDNRVGIFMDGAPLAVGSYCRIERNNIAYNDIGASLLPSVQDASFEGNRWVENDEQVSVSGGGTAQRSRFAGNYWSDYVGFDGDGDGVGDIPYRSEELFENLSDRSPTMRLFQSSLAQQAVDLSARLFPLVKPVAKFEDARPSLPTAPPVMAAAIPASGPGGLPLAVALAAAVVLSIRSRRAGPASTISSQEATPMRKRAMIEIEGLLKMFGHNVAVNNIHLTVYEGEAVALWGSNGAGKTTVIRCVLGLLGWQRGLIRVSGVDVLRDGVRARGFLGYVPQELRFHDDMTLCETMHFYASLRGLPVPVDGLARVGLEQHAPKRVGQLSGGMKQRLALALALLGDPPVLLLDEPTSNLDQRGREELMALLATLKRQGKTLLFSAHHLDEVAPLADRVILLENAVIASETTPMEFRRRLTVGQPPVTDDAPIGMAR